MTITVCFTYFKSLAWENLRAALYSLSRQDLSLVDSIVVVDNATADGTDAIQVLINTYSFPVPVRLLSFKHDDASKTHSWSTNTAIAAATAPWVFFTRADYLLAFGTLKAFVAEVQKRSDEWNGFVTGNVYHLNSDIGVCEQSAWRRLGPHVLRGYPGAEADYTCIDAGVWLARRDAFDRAGGMDENLSAWGHAQTDLQHRMHLAGTEFVRIPEVMFYHPQHAGHRDITVAHQQLRDKGVDIRAMWARHPGVQPY